MELTNPEKVFKQGCCQAALFLNEVEGKDGKTLRIGKITLQKAYMDKDGKWQNTTSFGVNDLPKLTLAIMEAYDYQTRSKQQEQPSPATIP